MMIINNDGHLHCAGFCQVLTLMAHEHYYHCLAHIAAIPETPGEALSLSQ